MPSGSSTSPSTLESAIDEMEFEAPALYQLAAPTSKQP